MATELYGSEAQVVSSIGTIGVSTNTNLFFIGTAPSGDLNTPIVINSLSDAYTKLGLSPSDESHNLRDAIISAFQVAGLAQITCIVVSHDADASTSTYIGDASLGTGLYAYEQALRDAPTAVNLVCLPRITDGTILATAIALCKNADGLKSYLIIDNVQSNDHVNEGGYPVASEIVADKSYSDEYASVVWGSIKTSANYVISGAAVRACLMAKADINYNSPAQVGGNLTVSGASSIVYKKVTTNELEEEVISYEKVKMTKSIANELSADGICSFRNRASTIITWGDHTSAFSGGTISDELGRFENRVRMQAMIANRWVIKYDPIIDKPLDLGLRNIIINEQLDYLNGLVAIGALIGEQSVAFVASDNPIDNLVQGQFVWQIVTTETNPFKYALAKIAFSTRGLAAYTL